MKYILMIMLMGFSVYAEKGDNKGNGTEKEVFPKGPRPVINYHCEAEYKHYIYERSGSRKRIIDTYGSKFSNIVVNRPDPIYLTFDKSENYRNSSTPNDSNEFGGFQKVVSSTLPYYTKNPFFIYLSPESSTGQKWDHLRVITTWYNVNNSYQVSRVNFPLGHGNIVQSFASTSNEGETQDLFSLKCTNKNSTK